MSARGRRGWLVALVLIALFGAWLWREDQALEPADGVLVAEEPTQQSLPDGLDPIMVDDVTLLPRARFAITARVLSIEGYQLDALAAIAPLDFALGWGPMSDSAVLDQIDISQSGRFFYWRTDSLPIPRREIERHATNVHLIPADAAILDQIEQVRVDETVELSGYLVDARSDDWRWSTSLRRDDTGAGACELLYVERVATRL